jgi:hypothetical protein
VKAVSKDGVTRMQPEPGDSETLKETAENFNKLMDSLGWFYANNVRVKVVRTRKGYKVTLGT